MSPEASSTEPSPKHRPQQGDLPPKRGLLSGSIVRALLATNETTSIQQGSQPPTTETSTLLRLLVVLVGTKVETQGVTFNAARDVIGLVRFL